MILYLKITHVIVIYMKYDSRSPQDFPKIHKYNNLTITFAANTGHKSIGMKTNSVNLHM